MGVKFCDNTGAWLDGYVMEWMEHAKKAVDKNWDYVVLIDGVEGSGKSGLAMTCAYYLDKSFSHERVVFTPEQFIEAVDKSSPGQAIVWDEFVLGGLSDDALKEIQTTVIKKLVTIRKKRLYIFLVIPYLFMLRTYFAVGRTRLLIHTHSLDGLARGYYRLYNYDAKKKLYFRGKKFYDYAVVGSTKHGMFGNAQKWNFMDWVAYEQKKDEATETIQVGGKTDNKYREAFKEMLFLWKNNMLPHNQKLLSEATGISQNTLTRMMGDIAIEKSPPTNTHLNNAGKRGVLVED
jgi:hypothetical protein